MMTDNETASTDKGQADTGNGSADLACTLTSPELRERKRTVLANLKEQTSERLELENCYVFTFPGTDLLLDELIDFIKTERACCPFFTFDLSICGDKSEARLELTGPPGAKEFITSEMGM